eukprot:CAMPEP_0170630960 /NCGR_PEP_ID=MMETSP0224-20130122/34322_1 /TAXON_ID=285029 /ORGANISM="Togula jolla, Strain CCCM 725" /LENGTH=605 /DNA_ID=CAMNT_0010959139 /DNA_START=18 /DNA_END=1835 /DNA_ORIENTATION=-
MGQTIPCCKSDSQETDIELVQATRLDSRILEPLIERLSSAKGADAYRRMNHSSLEEDDFVKRMSSSPSREVQLEADLFNMMALWLWPTVSNYVAEQLSVTVEPAIQRSLGSLRKSFSFDENRCHLGSKPVTFFGLTAWESAQPIMDGDLRNVTFRMDVIWEADLEVFFNLSMAKLGVKRVRLNGVVLVDFVGVQPKACMFQGVRSYFVNPPSLVTEFEGDLTSVLNLTWIKQRIQEGCLEQLSKMLVAPNRVGKVLDEQAEHFTVMRPGPKGILEVVVWKAEGLLAKDFNFFGKGTSDPYLVLRCGAVCFKSRPAKKTLNPNFEFRAMFQIVSLNHQQLNIQLLDEDQLGSEFLGMVDLPIQRMAQWGDGGKVSCDLSDKDGNAGENGHVLLSARFRPLIWKSKAEVEEMGICPDRAGFVILGIYSASNLPLGASSTQFWFEATSTGLLSENCAAPVMQVSPKLQQDRRAGEAHAERMAQERLLLRKIEAMRRHHMSLNDIADVLEIEPAHILILEGRAAGTFPTLVQHTIKWNCAFEFVVNTAEAIITLQLKSQTEDAKTTVLGTHTVPVCDLGDPGDSCVQTICLDDKIRVKVFLQVRFLAHI